MKIASLDKSIALSISTPGLGMTLTLSGHAWLFDRDGRIVGSITPVEPSRHLAVREIERCPACRPFIELHFSGGNGQ